MRSQLKNVVSFKSYLDFSEINNFRETTILMLHMMTSSKNADIIKNCFCIFAVTIREGTYPENFTHIALLVLDSPTPSPHERGAPKNAMSNRVNNKSIQCKRLFFVKDSFSREVTNFHVSLYMASLDVESLPTNILLQETISNAVQDLFHVHHYRGWPKIFAFNGNNSKHICI